MSLRSRYSFSKQKLVDICFWFVVAANLLLLNGFISSFFKVRAPISPLILIACIVILFYSPMPKKYSTLFNLLIGFFGLYIIISTISMIAYPENLHWRMDVVTLYRSYISSLVIFFSIYQYVYNKYKDEGYAAVEKIIRICSYFLLFPLFFTLFGKQIGLTDAMIYLRDYGDRQIGIFSNPNIAGLHANFTLCICLYSIISNRKGKIWWILLVPVSIYAAFLTLSKAAIICSLLILGYFMVFLLMTFMKQRKANKILSIVTITVFIFGATYIYFNFYELASKMSYAQVSRILDTLDLLSGKINSKTTSDRSEIAELAFPKIKEHFLIGNGFGSFHRFIEHQGLGVHNTALIIIGESGIFPSLLLILFVLVYNYKSYNTRGIENKFLATSIFLTFFFIAFLTSHNALEERMSNILLAILICMVSFNKNYQPLPQTNN